MNNAQQIAAAALERARARVVAPAPRRLDKAALAGLLESLPPEALPAPVVYAAGTPKARRPYRVPYHLKAEAFAKVLEDGARLLAARDCKA